MLIQIKFYKVKKFWFIDCLYNWQKPKVIELGTGFYSPYKQVQRSYFSVLW